MLQNFDATQVTGGLCELLQDTDFEDYNKEEALLEDIGNIVTGYINNAFGEMASVWVKGRSKGKSKSVWAYGTDFWPDITVEVRELPMIAIEVKLAKRDSSLADSIASVIGKAIVDSVQYSQVIALVLDRTESNHHQHWFDNEIEDQLWDNHYINLVVMQ